MVRYDGIISANFQENGEGKLVLILWTFLWSRRNVWAVVRIVKYLVKTRFVTGLYSFIWTLARLVMATSFWGAGAFGARAARIKTRISYVHRISSYRRCARPWAFTNMSGETPYFDLFFVSIRSARRGSTSKIPVYDIYPYITSYHIFIHSYTCLSLMKTTQRHLKLLKPENRLIVLIMIWYHTINNKYDIINNTM